MSNTPLLYRGMTWNSMKSEYEFAYGLPSYGFDTDEISEIGTQNGEFVEINPVTLGKITGYTDCQGKCIFTGDITSLEVDGKIREFEVIETTTDREYNTLNGFKQGTETKVKVRLKGVIAFKWSVEGQDYILLPCVDRKGKCDTERMKIVGNIHQRAAGSGK